MGGSKIQWMFKKGVQPEEGEGKESEYDESIEPYGRILI